MANIFRQITLNSKGLKAGPFFDVYYSADCSTYTIATDGSNVFLPSDGSQVIVTIPDNTQCLKMVNLSPTCDNNFVVENIGLTTTTTTSTTSTTSTSTTTTASPTTTSTTTTVAPKYWNANYCATGTAAPFPLKVPGNYTAGQVVSAVVADTTYCYTLTTEYSGTPFIYYTATQFYISCAACGVTTTTTSTTTLQPVWYNLYNCSNGQIETSTQYPAGTFSVNQRVVYGGALFFYVVSSTTTDPGGIKWSVTSAGSGLTGCPATTSTTTTTTLAPITLTVSGSCVGGYGTGQILANNFAGSTGTYQYIASGSSETNAILAVTGASGTRYALSGASSYNFTNLGNGNVWVAILDSTGRTGLSSVVPINCGTTTTTSTTTLQPGYFRGLDCRDNVTHIYSTLQAAGTFNSGDRITANGGVNYVIDGFTTTNPGGTLYAFTATGLFGCPATTSTTTTTSAALTVTNGSVTCTTITGAWRSSFTGGSGTYSYVAYADSQANASIAVNGGAGSRVTLGGGATYYDWNTIPNGTWYVAVKDSSGGVSVQNTPVVVNCTTTTTTSTTSTSTTTLQPVWYNMTQCYTGTAFTSAQYTIGAFSVGQIVSYGGSLYLTIASEVTSNPGGASLSIAATGLSSCPATTTTTTTTTVPPMDFTYTTYCSNGEGYVTILDITGGGGGQDQYSVDGITWYDFTGTPATVGPFANGTNPNIKVRNTGGGGTNKATGVVSCATTTSTTTTTAAPARVNVNFSLTFDAGNDGTLEIYSASPAGSGYTLDSTLTFDGASYSLSLLPGDAFYATITQTSRATSTQRGQISTIRDGITEDYVVTGAGALPKSVSSTPTTVTAGSPYFVYGLCGDQI